MFQVQRQRNKTDMVTYIVFRKSSIQLYYKLQSIEIKFIISTMRLRNLSYFSKNKTNLENISE